MLSHALFGSICDLAELQDLSFWRIQCQLLKCQNADSFFKASSLLLCIDFRIRKEALKFAISLHHYWIFTFLLHMFDQKRERKPISRESTQHSLSSFGFYTYFCQSLGWSTEIVPIIFENLPKELLYLSSVASYKTLRSTIVLSLFPLSQISLFMSGFLPQCQNKYSTFIWSHGFC